MQAGHRGVEAVALPGRGQRLGSARGPPAGSRDSRVSSRIWSLDLADDGPISNADVRSGQVSIGSRRAGSSTISRGREGCGGSGRAGVAACAWVGVSALVEHIDGPLVSMRPKTPRTRERSPGWPAARCSQEELLDLGSCGHPELLPGDSDHVARGELAPAAGL